MKKMIFLKRFLFSVLFLCVSSVVSFAFDYWYMDVIIGIGQSFSSLSGTTQRAYFFRDLETLEKATGFPKNGKSGIFPKDDWQWVPAEMAVNPIRQAHLDQILAQMRRNNFSAAYVLDSIGDDGGITYRYSVLLLSNGKAFWNGIRLDNPLRFP